MQFNHYICAIDIGSSKIASCLAEIKKRRIHSLYFETLPVKGVKNGAIVDHIEVVGVLTKLLKNLKSKSGVNIKNVNINISGQDIATRHSRACLPLAERGNKVITEADIRNVIEQARILGSSLEEDIIQFLAFNYAIDSKKNIINPIGLYSHRLEVDLYLICAKVSAVESLNRAVNQAGFEVNDLYFSGLATAEAVFGREEKQGLNLLCDIGADTTELLLFKDGLLCDVEIIALGSEDLTLEIAKELKIPVELAEDIKRSHGAIDDPGIVGDEDKEILIKKEHSYKPIKQKEVSQIITSQIKSLSCRIKESIDKKAEAHQINSFVVVGRSVLLEGFIELMESVLGVPVKLGRIRNPDIAAFRKEKEELSGQKYLTYLTALGMVCVALEEAPQGIFSSSDSAKNPFMRAVNRFKQVYQEYF